MKKLLRITLCLMLLLVLIAIPTSAKWSATFNVDMVHGYVASDEEAEIDVLIYPYADIADFDIDITLERRAASGWIEVASWTDITQTARRFFYSGRTANVTTGYTYRLHVTGTVDDGENCDELDQYSNTNVY